MEYIKLQSDEYLSAGVIKKYFTELVNICRGKKYKIEEDIDKLQKDLENWIKKHYKKEIDISIYITDCKSPSGKYHIKRQEIIVTIPNDFINEYYDGDTSQANFPDYVLHSIVFTILHELCHYALSNNKTNAELKKIGEKVIRYIEPSDKQRKSKGVINKQIEYIYQYYERPAVAVSTAFEIWYRHRNIDDVLDFAKTLKDKTYEKMNWKSKKNSEQLLCL